MSNYTLDQAQRDIAQLRFALTSLQNNAQLGALTVAGAVTINGAVTVVGTPTFAAQVVAQSGINCQSTLTFADGSTWKSIAGGGVNIVASSQVNGPDGTIWSSSGIAMGSGKSISADSWHNISIPSGWSDNSGNSTGFRYKKLSEANMMVIQVNMTSPSTAPANGTTIATLPVGYRQLQGEQDAYLMVAASVASGQQLPHFFVDTSGNIKVWGFAGTTNIVSAGCRGIFVVALD